MSLPPLLQQVIEAHSNQEYETGEEFDFKWVRFEAGGPDGFAVKIAQSSDGEFLVELGEDGAHSDPYGEHNFLDLANTALAENVRLRQVWKGGRLFKAYLEKFESGQWKGQFYYRRMFLSWFLKKHVTVHVNQRAPEQLTDV